jgi:hypothetical protein
MSEVIQRTNSDGITWREVAPLTQRVPPCGPATVAAPCPSTGPVRIAPEPGERLGVQEYIAADGAIRRAELPEIGEPGRWRETQESDRRVMAFEYARGGRRCIAVE